jgi:hypothetical protein
MGSNLNYPAVMEKIQDELLEINDQQSGVQEQGNEAEFETEDGVIGAGELNTLMDIENIGDYLSMFGADLIRRKSMCRSITQGEMNRLRFLINRKNDGIISSAVRWMGSSTTICKTIRI